MISRIYVTPKISSKKGAMRVLNSYLIDHNLSEGDLAKIAETFTNPVLETYSINQFPKINFSYAIEIGFLPGVTDNVGSTARETIKDLLGLSEAPEVYSSKVYLLQNKTTLRKVQELALTLHNPLIERSFIARAHELKKSGNLPLKVPEVVLQNRVSVINVPLDVPDEELVKIGNFGVMDPETKERRGPLALDLNSMKVIKEYFSKLKRYPTDIELESLAQTWSEHCKHTIFANPIDDIKDGLYKTYIKRATEVIRKQKGKKDFCISVFSDNAGGIVFDKDYMVTHKVETHNSPSALDPYGGAMTGIVGVNRDTIGFGLGAKPVANTYGFCFGNPEDTRPIFRDKELKQKMMPPKRIMEGVIKGINAGGNCSGIPTVSGFTKYDDRYKGKPLVFAGTVGIMPRKIEGRLAHEKSAKAGDYVVVVGGRVGADGIHGATFSSVVMDSNSPATAVQIGDPITQKKLSDAIVKEARAMNLYNSITDNGAGGISCSVAEMARECGGAIVHIDKVPLKYPGLRPWEIWISESQERMTLAVPKKKWQIFERLMQSRGVEATIIGEFTDSGNMVVNYRGVKIMDMAMEFLHNGLPKHKLESARTVLKLKEPERPKKINFSLTLENLIRDKNISGYSFISQQYDHEVQSSSVVKPLSGAGRINTDAQVLRPILNSVRGVVLSAATYPSYGDISTYDMAACAIDTAIRNSVCAGGRLEHTAILDNFCWCSSNDKERLGQLVDSLKACYKYAVGFGTPFISGKDSMFNDFKGYDEKGNAIKISIPPTLLISSISVMPDLYKATTPEFKNEGDVIYLLGETNTELGASEYHKLIANKTNNIGGKTPKVDLEKNIKTYKIVEKLIEDGLLSSAISVNSGGLGVALTKASVGGMLGINVDLTTLKGEVKNMEAKLFSESQGRILVSVSPRKVKKFEQIAKRASLTKLGKVSTDKKFVVTESGKKVVATTVDKLYKAYHEFSNSMK